MIQVAQFQRARVPVLAVGALGLVALAALNGPRIGQPSTSSAAAAVSVEIAAPIAQRPVIQAVPQGTCGANAYVPGDMVGDASPAEVYARLCP